MALLHLCKKACYVLDIVENIGGFLGKSAMDEMSGDWGGHDNIRTSFSSNQHIGWRDL